MASVCDDVFCGPNLPTLADLKKFLRDEKPLFYHVLEEYLHNAATLVSLFLKLKWNTI